MSKKHRSPNRAGFHNRCDEIKTAEKDVDALLRAARLKRHESSREPLSAQDIIKICTIFAIAFILCAVLFIGYLSGHFVPALLGMGFLILIGGAFAACM